MSDKVITKVMQRLFIFATVILLSFQGFMVNIPNVQAESELDSQNVFSYLKVGEEYVSQDNQMTVTVDSIVIEEKEKYKTYTVKYTEKNNTSDSKIDEGSLKLFFTNAEAEAQTGFFGTLMPGQSSTHTYTFEVLNHEIPLLIEYAEDNFFNTAPQVESLKWRVGKANSPIIDAIYDTSLSFEGNGEPNMEVFAEIDGIIAANGITDSNGDFTLKSENLSAGISIDFYLLDENGEKGEVESVTVLEKDVTAPAKPEVNEVTDQAKEVTGTAEAKSTIIVKANDKEIGQAATNEDGTFKVGITAQEGDTELSITATDQADNTSEATVVTVKDVTAPEKPEVNGVSEESTQVTGKAEVGSTVEVTLGGQETKSGKTKDDGTFTVTIPAQKVGTVLSITATDKAGNISATETVAVTPGTVIEQSTSRLGQINSGESSIYPNSPGEEANKVSSEEFKASVYYIKKQATYKNELYYLLSTQASATNGVIGWINASDVTTHAHVGVDNKSKTFYVKGTGGVGYNRAWGSQKNLVYPDLKPLKNAEFKVHKTEKVGNNLWYRGELNGKQTWIHSNHLAEKPESYKEQATSLLVQLKTGESYLYSTPANHSDKKVTASNKDSVHYVKKQATYNNELYYLLSSQPSATSGVIGWMKALDVTSYAHVGVDNKSKTFYVKGTNGVAYDRAWGGKKNLVYSDFKSLKNGIFKVDKTEKVGNNIWYRGVLNGKKVWIHSNHISELTSSYTELSTSRLGQVKAENSVIYSAPFNAKDTKTSDSYKGSVYYIKKQAIYNKELYYLLSSQASATSGVIGWIKSPDVTTHAHVGVDNKSKTFYVKGTGGVGYDRAWGSKKNLVYPDLKPLKNAVFKVHKTEKIGNNVWYRGDLNGKRTWIHSNHLTGKPESYKEQATSRLVQLKTNKSYFYSTPSNHSDKKDAVSHKDSVYYVKKQATYNKELYYLLSSQPSATSGAIGWMKASEVTSYTHVGVDNKSKIFYVKGAGGVGYDRAWGGKKNLVYTDLEPLKDVVFKVNKTEKVGNNIWYRGELDGKRTWIHSNHLVE